MDSGNGATIAFTSMGFTAQYQEIGELDQQGGALDDSHLGTSGEATKIPQDLYEPGTQACRFNWDPTDAPPSLHTVDTITITFPKLNSGSAAAATLAGTGFLVGRKFPSLQNNQLNVGEFTIQWDGKTGPTYTPEA